MKINEKRKIEINGFPQKIHIWGTNSHNQIILFVHGGPGNPFRHHIREHFLPLTDSYTLAVYDERGAGGSYRKMDPHDLRFQDYVKDIEAWAEWLCSRFDQKQVYLVGESWGSFIGTLALGERPELFKAYIGYGQVVDMQASLLIQYRLALEAARKYGDKEKENLLIGLKEPTEEGFSDKKGIGIFSSIMYELLKNPHEASYRKREVYPLYFSPEYSLKEKIDWSKGLALSSQAYRLWGVETASIFDFLGPTPRFAMPYYVFQGHKDFITPWQQIPDYIKRISAPEKGYLFFENSGHVSAFEEPDRFMDELRKRFK